MIKRRLIYFLLFIFVLFSTHKLNIVFASSNNYEYFPIGINYLDPSNHEGKRIGDYKVNYKTINPFVIKSNKEYSLVANYQFDHIERYEILFYDNNNNLIGNVSDSKEIYSDYGIKKIVFTTPNNASRLVVDIDCLNKLDAIDPESVDSYFTLSEGNKLEPHSNFHINYDGPMKDLKPVINGEFGLYITDINNPISVQEIKSSLVAIDDVDGDVTDSIIVFEDTYTNNINILGTYYVTFRAFDSSNNFSDFTVYITVIDTTSPNISGPNKYDAYISKVLDLNLISNSLQAIDNYDGIVSVKLIEDNYSENYNKVGRYTLVYEAVDSSNNRSEYIVVVDVYDDIAPIIDGPINHIKSNDLYVDLNNFVSEYTAFDETDGDITSKIKVLSDNYSQNQYEVGIWEVILEVEDNNKNKTSLTIYIEVIDKIGPIFFVDTSKIIIDLTNNPLDINNIINQLQSLKVIEDNVVVNIVEDNYSENMDTPGKYNVKLEYNNKLLNLEVEVVDKLVLVDDVEKVPIIKKIAKIFINIWQWLINLFKKLFYK